MGKVYKLRSAMTILYRAIEAFGVHLAMWAAGRLDDAGDVCVEVDRAGWCQPRQENPRRRVAAGAIVLPAPRYTYARPWECRR